MLSGLSFEKLLVIGVIAVILLGPERLPRYAQQLTRWIRQLRDYANGARDRMREELGPEFDQVDWRKLDPRQYDPRRIIREALADVDPFADSTPPSTVVRASDAAPALTVGATRMALGERAPFDPEAT